VTSSVLLEHSAAQMCVFGREFGSDSEQGEASAAATPATSCRLGRLLSAVAAWVGQANSPAAQAALAAAAGGDLQWFRDQLQSLEAAQLQPWDSVTDASLKALVHQLQATGGMLAALAVPHFCNNPACGNLSAGTDLQLVSGRSCLCGGCRTARYCGRACQRQAWSRHKPVYEALAAAAAAATATAAAGTDTAAAVGEV
jgi:hypothetical protein